MRCLVSIKNWRKDTHMQMLRLTKIVHNLSEMFQETIVHYYVNFVNSPYIKAKGRICIMILPLRRWDTCHIVA